MESQDREPAGDSSEVELELEPLWLRRLQQVHIAVICGAFSVSMLVNLILFPHIITAVSMLCFAAAAVVGVRAMGRSPEFYGWKPRPRSHMRPLFAQFRRIALLFVLFMGGILVHFLRGYLPG
jgi:hypothetical protein